MASFGNGRRVAIIEGVRTPFARAGTTLRHLSAIDLGKIAATGFTAPDAAGSLSGYLRAL